MNRRNREFSIFSLSAIDLFACAMGAFVLLAIILFQYYLKAIKADKAEDTPQPIQQVVVDPNADLVQQVEQLKQALAAAEKAAAEAKKQARKAQSKAQTLQDEATKNRQLAFLGIVTKCKSFVILIDMSGSMKDYEALMVRTVGELLGQMDDSYKCQIIGFQGDTRDTILPTLIPWQTPVQPVPMNPANVAGAEKFCASLVGNFRSGTPTHLALTNALGYPVEAIFLLTDGAPTDIENGNVIVERITRENAGKMKIYAVAIGDYRAHPQLVAFLEDLSHKNGGKFLGISE